MFDAKTEADEASVLQQTPSPGYTYAQMLSGEQLVASLNDYYSRFE